jgi:glucose/arabinose dehydrogenase
MLCFALFVFLLLFPARHRALAALQEEVRINAGGLPFTDAAGQTWSGDQFFTGGFVYATKQPISGTTSQPLFQTERSGVFSYKIPVSSGRFRVTLYFAEIYFTTYGKRIFTVTAEGSPVLSLLDVAQSAGPNAALEKTFDVETVDGSLDLAFIPNLENAKLSALRIIHLREGPAPLLGVIAPPDFTASTAPSSVIFTGTVTGRSAVDPSYRSVWEQTEGPALAEILDPTAASTSIRFTAPGIYSFRLSASCYSSTASASTRVIVPGDTTAQPPMRIRCGGSAYTDSAGKVWLADQFFKGGGTFSSTGAVQGTPDSNLYLSERFGAFGYHIPVRNGLYAVRIHLAEIYFKTVGSRIFNITAEGKPFGTSVDIVKRSGFMTAAVLNELVQVNDSVLNLEFLALTENPKISALELVPIALDPFPLQIDPGPDIVLQLPKDSAQLQARLVTALPSDPSAYYRWVQTAGTLPASLDNPGAIVTLARFHSPGPYRFKVQVSSNSQMASAEVGVLVLAEVLPPLSVQTSASSPNGSVPSETQLKAVVSGIPSARAGAWTGSWVQTDGPSASNLTSANSPNCLASLLAPGLYTFRYSATFEGSTASSEVSVLATGDTNGQNPIRIRAGAGSYKDSLGNQWSGDTLFTGGGFFSVTAPVKGTADPALYQSERHGTFNYRIPLRNGLYTLRLHFAELWHKNTGARVFNVNAEGKPILSALDLFKTAGLLNAWIWSGIVRVADGLLDLDFLPLTENPKVAGVEVLPLALDPPPLGVDVGAEQILRLPQDTLLVQAQPTGAPAQASAATCLWSQVSGPDEAHILTPAALVSQIHFHQSGNYRFRATLTSGAATASAELSVRVLPVPDPPGVLRIRCGGTAFTDSTNRVWAADAFYAGGSTYASTGSVKATADPQIYLTERTGKAFSYKIPAANGEYTVRLHFAEIYWTQAQKRLFNVTLGGLAVLKGLDLCALAGSKTALMREFSTTVTNGFLELAFSAQMDNAKISALEVLPVRNPAHLLHVVIRAPEWVVDYSNAGFVPISLSGAQSHTHEFGQVLTRFEWREGAQLLSTQQDFTLNATVGSHTYTLTIWDSENPQATLQDSVTVAVLPSSAVRGVKASYFPTASAAASGLNPSFVEVLPGFRLEGTNNSVGGSGSTSASVVLRGVWTAPQAGAYTPLAPQKLPGLLAVDGQAWGGPLFLAAGVHELSWRLDAVSSSLLPLEVTWKRDDNTTGSFLPVSHNQSAMAPQVNQMTATGPALGGEIVEINGLGFFPAASVAVLWGGRRLTAEILEAEPERILLVTPPGSGILSVQVQTPQGTSNPMPYAYQAGTAPVAFQSRGVFTLPGPTQAAWGPDGRLYIASLTGAVTALAFDDQYNVIQSQIIPGVQNTPAYNAIGIAFSPWESPAEFNIYLGHARLFVNDGRSHVRPSPYIGQVSTLASPLFLSKPLISGLPCTNHDHGVNGISFDNSGQLYVSIGGQTNAGIPNHNLGSLDESPFSAAILTASPGRAGFNAQISYRDAKTNLPSPDQNDSATATPVGARDLRLYSTGLRNAFGIVWATNGRLYGTDNGPNTGFGGASLTPTTQAGDPVTPDKVLLLGKNHYYGHPNRNRGRLDPRENRYQSPWETPLPEVATPHLSLLPSSRDGIDEYRATAFGGALRGSLLVQEWNGSLSALGLSADGRRVESTIKQLWGTHRGLGVVCGPGGAILVVDYTGSQVIVSLPDDKAATGMVAYDIFPWRAPASGEFTFVIGGKQFGTLANTTVLIGSQQTRLTSVTPQRIKGVLPAAATPTAAFLPVLVTSGGKTSVIPEGFRYLLKPGQGVGVWKEEPQLPFPAGITTAAESAGLIYVLSEDCSVFQAFDTVTGVWTSDFPPPPFSVMDPCIVGAGLELVLIGSSAPGTPWKVQIYNPATRSWRQGGAGPWNSLRPAVAANGGLVYVCGGEIAGGPSQVVAVYSVQKNQWLPLPQMPLACLEPAAVCSGDSLWIFGGASGVQNLGVQSYDVPSGTWSVRSTSSSKSLPNRFGARAVCFAEELYLIGGRLESGEVLRSVDALLPQTLTWRSDALLPDAAWGLGVIANESEIFLTGGRNATGTLKTARSLVR